MRRLLVWQCRCNVDAPGFWWITRLVVVRVIDGLTQLRRQFLAVQNDLLGMYRVYRVERHHEFTRVLHENSQHLLAVRRDSSHSAPAKCGTRSSNVSRKIRNTFRCCCPCFSAIAPNSCLTCACTTAPCGVGCGSWSDSTTTRRTCVSIKECCPAGSALPMPSGTRPWFMACRRH